MALFRDHPGVPVPEENFWTSSCKRRLTEAGSNVKEISNLTKQHYSELLFKRSPHRVMPGWDGMQNKIFGDNLGRLS